MRCQTCFHLVDFCSCARDLISTIDLDEDLQVELEGQESGQEAPGGHPSVGGDYEGDPCSEFEGGAYTHFYAGLYDTCVEAYSLTIRRCDRHECFHVVSESECCGTIFWHYLADGTYTKDNQ